MTYTTSLGGQNWTFDDLRSVMGRASPLRSGDVLAGVAAASEEERVAAKFCLADLPLTTFLNTMREMRQALSRRSAANVARPGPAVQMTQRHPGIATSPDAEPADD